MISDVHRQADDNFALLGYYAAGSSNFLRRFGRLPETPVRNCRYSLRNNPEDQKTTVLCSSMILYFCCFLLSLKPSRISRLFVFEKFSINPLNAELNPICHLLALLGAHHILHVSRIRVNSHKNSDGTCLLNFTALPFLYLHLLISFYQPTHIFGLLNSTGCVIFTVAECNKPLPT